MIRWQAAVLVTFTKLSSLTRSISFRSGSMPARVGCCETTIFNVCLPLFTRCRAR
jgi:hypothetical protein